ncbi:thioredoxin family protein [Roseateles saccharophilus]|uniref:Protein disulfide-isomerase n=1 Tax=Roseateles saccharophilus TaxID=304 RepID=A0A4R3UJF5_ROSSA|nr:thioredoxin family protein [Roseateles saccharophilus]MDG0834228.1 thioredoxin family protein [Roseateles saccharophilus]TCU89910.1 protein disulfide-isomerase [Roseateles saccharophilus]
MRLLIASLLLAASLGAHAGPPAIYDEGADAKAALRATLAEAAQARLPVLVVFGANWCGDCRMLDNSFKHGPSAPLIAKSFKVVKVDVGRFDRNVDIAETYRVPLKKGIPAVAVLSPEGKLLYATEGGELADARKMGDQGVYDFFTRVATSAR